MVLPVLASKQLAPVPMPQQTGAPPTAPSTGDVQQLFAEWRNQLYQVPQWAPRFQWFQNQAATPQEELPATSCPNTDQWRHFKIEDLHLTRSLQVFYPAVDDNDEAILRWSLVLGLELSKILFKNHDWLQLNPSAKPLKFYLSTGRPESLQVFTNCGMTVEKRGGFYRVAENDIAILQIAGSHPFHDEPLTQQTRASLKDGIGYYFLDTFFHELGHAVWFLILTDTQLRRNIEELFELHWRNVIVDPAVRASVQQKVAITPWTDEASFAFSAAEKLPNHWHFAPEAPPRSSDYGLSNLDEFFAQWLEEFTLAYLKEVLVGSSILPAHPAFRARYKIMKSFFYSLDQGVNPNAFDRDFMMRVFQEEGIDIYHTTPAPPTESVADVVPEPPPPYTYYFPITLAGMGGGFYHDAYPGDGEGGAGQVIFWALRKANDPHSLTLYNGLGLGLGFGAGNFIENKGDLEEKQLNYSYYDIDLNFWSEHLTTLYIISLILVPSVGHRTLTRGDDLETTFWGGLTGNLCVVGAQFCLGPQIKASDSWYQINVDFALSVFDWF